MPDGVDRVMFDAMFDCHHHGVKHNMVTFKWNGNITNPSEKQICEFAPWAIMAVELTQHPNPFYTQQTPIPKNHLTMPFTEILA